MTNTCTHPTFFKKALSLLLALVLSASCASLLPMEASAASGYNANVLLTSTRQVVDELWGVQALYNKNGCSASDDTFSCAALVKRLYKAKFGVTVYNLLSGRTPQASEAGYIFRRITSGYVPGDIVRGNGHWAIVKEVRDNEKTLVLLEQNWSFLSRGQRYCKVNRTVSPSSVAVFRLYKNGKSITATQGSTTDEFEELMFDAQLYYNMYPDLKRKFAFNAEALREHFFRGGGLEEGRVASIYLSTPYYLAANPDVAAAARASGGNIYRFAYNHFKNFGLSEQRQGSKAFSVSFYRSKYSDLQKAFGNDMLSYIRHHQEFCAEDRITSPSFNINIYKKFNPDVVKAFNNNSHDIILHYIQYVDNGSEHRTCT